MAYEEIKDGIIKNINTRKEFYSLKLPTDKSKQSLFPGIIKDAQIKKLSGDIIPRFMLERELKLGRYFRLHSYQTFIKNFINPNTPYNRLLIKWETGTGKTIAAISMAKSFIDYYRKESERGSLQIGSVFVLGFTKHIFRRELLRYPELGFISRSELRKLKQLTKLVFRGTRADIDNLHDFRIRISKRISNRKNNGFFRFFGYKEFVNKIFLPREQDININTMSEEEILDSLSINKIKFNEDLLESFTNSLIICDEIHNVYNSEDKNNWGIAIQSVLDNVPSVRAVFLSATPLNNSPTEVVDLLNLLLPGKSKLKKEDLFSNVKSGTLKSGSLNKIKKLTMGRVSFIRDTNPEYFPSKEYLGESIPGISYLKFTRCPMSPFQYNTYKSVFRGTLTQDSQYLIDFALPNPDCQKPKCLGMFQTKQIKSALKNASQKWKDKYGLQWEDNMIVGDALEKDRLKVYSNKYYTLINHIQKSLKEKKGKIFIFHNIVHISGVLFIQEVLKKNGVLELNGIPSGDTICTNDGLTLNEHKKKKMNLDEFNPARFISVHSEIDKSTMNKYIERFNNPDNAEGHSIMILVGSRVVKESYDIKAVQNVYIMGRPDNIPTLIQIIGRAVRKNSHIDLPPDQRNVRIKIFTSCLPVKTHVKGGKTSYYQLSYEEIKYKEKMNIYKIIQHIEKTFHEGAIDMPVNVRLMFTDQGRFKTTDPLGPIDFKPDYQIPKSFSLSDMIMSTFETFYEDNEMNTIISIIKRLFIEQDVAWTYDQLLDAVKHPPYNWEIHVNTDTFSEGNFQIALAKLLWSKDEKYIEPLFISEKILNPETFEENKYEYVIDTMTDSNDKVILLPNGQACVIVPMGIYYCLMPLNTKILAPIIDIDMPYRIVPSAEVRNINIKSYLEIISPAKEYPKKRQKFQKKYQFSDLFDMEDAICTYGSEFHIMFLEEIISYVFNVLIGKNRPSTQQGLHEFYFKMLYYYDIIGIVIWASTARNYIEEKYSQYITKAVPIPDVVMKEKEEKIKIEKRTDIVRMLESSINSAGCNWCPEESQKKYHSSLTSSLEIIKKPGKRIKVSANILPVGHFMDEIPRFYDPTNRTPWIDSPGYINKVSKQWKENDLIIGYDEKSKTGVHIRFKIRSPIQDIKKFEDIRKIEKGSICSSKSKTFLLRLANVLKLDLGSKINIVSLCNSIRAQLIYNEIRERSNPNSKVKWFYGYWQKMPQI